MYGRHPQGTVPSLIIFIIYYNGITDITIGNITNFRADPVIF